MGSWSQLKGGSSARVLSSLALLCLMSSVVSAKQNCYQKLRVSTSASESEIKQAFRRAARKYHPDKVDESKKDAAEAKFKELARCYEILKDPEAKQMYDSSGYNDNFDQMGGPGGGPGGAGHHFHFRSDDSNFDFADLFSTFFGGGGGSSAGSSSRSHSRMRGRAGGMPGGMPGFGGGMGGGFPGGGHFGGNDMGFGGRSTNTAVKKKSVTVSVTLEDLLEDHTQEVSLGRSRDRRSGRTPTISVDVRAGAIDGSKLKVDDQAADEYEFTLKVKKHRLFERRKGKLQSDLYYRLPLTLTEAINGGTFTVPTIDGGTHEITVDYASPDSTVKVKRLGLPRLSGSSRSRGSMIIEFDIRFPKHLTDRDKEQFNNVAAKWVYPALPKQPKTKKRRGKSEL